MDFRNAVYWNEFHFTMSALPDHRVNRLALLTLQRSAALLANLAISRQPMINPGLNFVFANILQWSVFTCRVHKPLLLISLNIFRRSNHFSYALRWSSLCSFGVVRFRARCRADGVLQSYSIPLDLNSPFCSSKMVNLLCQIRVIWLFG